MRLVTESRVLSPALVEACREELDEIDGRIRPGTVHRVGPTIQRLAGPEVPREESPQRIIARLQADLRSFVASQGLEHVVVVNVASTEPPLDAGLRAGGVGRAGAAVADPAKCPLPASSLYAIAALDLGCSYINFTPSLGSAPAAIDELARLRGTRHMGCDGKTGETLLKSVLAPMFRAAQPAGDELGRPQHLRQHGRPGARRSGQQGEPRSQARTTCWARSSATSRRPWSRSSTSRAWAIGRRPGTTSTSTVSWARR